MTIYCFTTNSAFFPVFVFSLFSSHFWVAVSICFMDFFIFFSFLNFLMPFYQKTLTLLWSTNWFLQVNNNFHLKAFKQKHLNLFNGFNWSYCVMATFLAHNRNKFTFSTIFFHQLNCLIVFY